MSSRVTAFLLLTALISSSLASASPLLHSPKNVLVKWIDGRPDSVLEMKQALDPNRFKEPLDRCRDARIKDYSLKNLVELTLDSNGFHSTRGFRSVCVYGSDGSASCFYFQEITFKNE